MDRNNLQMSANGNEFALRVALCDLIQRLKRSEFMCKYLEQCRNELANEVIKLRTYNCSLLEKLVDNSRNKSGFNNPMQTAQHQMPNQLDQLDPGQNDQTDYKPNIRMVKLNSIVDESWEEITNRLITQLKKEILIAENEQNQNDEIQEKKSTLCSSGSNYFDLKSDQNADNLDNLDLINEANEYETQEQHMAINDLNDVKIDELNREISNDDNKEMMNKELNKDQESNSQDKIKSTFKLLEDYSLLNMNNNLKVIEVHENRDQQKSNIHELLKDHLKQQDKQPNQLNLVEKILHNYNLDLEEITRQIMIQNDKLIKLKGKQIRNYFRRQLDINKANTEANSELKIKD